jgi:hypothetical protein
MAIKWHAGSLPNGGVDDDDYYYNYICQPAWDGGRYVYVLGSDRNNNGLFQRYDIGSDSWTVLTPPPGVFRGFSAVAAHGGKVYVFAGTEGTNGAASGSEVVTTRIYDTSSGS